MEAGSMNPKPDNRNDNVENIQYNIKMTKENINRANEMKSVTSDPKKWNALEDKNKRREEALDSMRNELEDEIEDMRDYDR